MYKYWLYTYFISQIAVHSTEKIIGRKKEETIDLRNQDIVWAILIHGVSDPLAIGEGWVLN